MALNLMYQKLDAELRAVYLDHANVIDMNMTLPNRKGTPMAQTSLRRGTETMTYKDLPVRAWQKAHGIPPAEQRTTEKTMTELTRNDLLDILALAKTAPAYIRGEYASDSAIGSWAVATVRKLRQAIDEMPQPGFIEQALTTPR